MQFDKRAVALFLVALDQFKRLVGQEKVPAIARVI